MGRDLVAVLVGGTLTLDLFADSYYQAAAKQFGHAHVMTIPGYGIHTVEHASELFNKRLERDLPGCQVAALCHSQSGLIVSWSALDNPDIVQVAGASTPFSGTKAAFLGRPILKSAEDMLPGSGFLRRLHERLPELTAADRLATVALRNDRVVPWPSSRVEGARNYYCGTDAEYAKARKQFPDTRHIRAMGHLSVLDLFEHIVGLQLLEPALRHLLGILWHHAQDTAAGIDSHKAA